MAARVSRMLCSSSTSKIRLRAPAIMLTFRVRSGFLGYRLTQPSTTWMRGFQLSMRNKTPQAANFRRALPFLCRVPVKRTKAARTALEHRQATLRWGNKLMLHRLDGVQSRSPISRPGVLASYELCWQQPLGVCDTDAAQKGQPILCASAGELEKSRPPILVARQVALTQIVASRGRDGGTGRRSGLKIRRPSGHGGSTPPPGTIR